ncbi:MAG: SgcJ/EcaC family oxidoreductase [Acidobacteriia bacterium]|nr:SgcJ/EcaC family oxidoreductase [Terriglobia bacterium]
MKIPVKKPFLTAFGIAFASLYIGCGAQPVPDPRAVDESAIQELEAAWTKTAEAKDAAGFVSYYSDDASVLAPNAPVATGAEPIRSTISQLFALPGFSLTFKSNKVEVARGGDLAYSHGAYSMTMNDPKGSLLTDKGKFLTVFRKNAEGKWKVVADMFNTDLPMPAPPTK